MATAMASVHPRALALTRRTVHLKVYPTARTFAERREVLRVMESFGEVAMFRSLKVRNTSAVLSH